MDLKVVVFIVVVVLILVTHYKLVRIHSAVCSTDGTFYGVQAANFFVFF